MIYKNKNLNKVGQFTKVEPISIPSNIKHLYLSHNAISEIYKNSFEHLTKLTHLELNCNQLKHIKKRMFIGLSSLESLNLASNNITSIEHNSFEDMNNLLILDLSLNKYLVGPNGKLPLHLYTGSTNSLHILHLQGIIDGVENATLGSELQPLPHLTKLFIGGTGSFCSIKFIHETFFINMPNIKTFVISRCPLVHINPSAYLNLRNLSSLSISYMKYDLVMAFKELEGLQNSSLRHLQLIHLYDSRYIYRWLTDIHAGFLRNIPLISLDLSENNIGILSQCFADLLPKTLRLIRLSRNTLTKITHVLKSLRFLPQLCNLDVSDQDASNLFFNDTVLCNFSSHNEDQDTSPFLQDDLEQEECSVTIRDFPPNLKILKARSFLDSRNHIFKYHWPSNNSLEVIDLSGSYFTRWGNGCMPESIKHADLSNNYCTNINKHFFSINNSIECLRLSNNLLGPVFTDDKTGEVFANLRHTKLLDVSMNSVYQLPGDFFKGLPELETLIVSNNKIQILNVSFLQMPKLKFIDFSKNSINWITRNSRAELDTIAIDHHVALDLTYNPLPCSCAGLEILIWLNNTNVQLWDKEFLTCIHESGETERNIISLQKELETLQRQCTYQALTLFMCVSAMLIICTLLTSLFMYRYRWKLRYLWSIALVKLFGAELKTEENGYRFDAYILYAEETRTFVLRDCVRELEEKRGHRLCIEERDFMPGTYIVSNIVSGVQNSSKTVPIVTPGFYQGDYTEYGVKMALMEEIFARRSVLYLCLYEPTDNEDLSHDFLTVMKNNRYIEFPPQDEESDEIQQIFWNRMSSVIGKSEESFSPEQDTCSSPPELLSDVSSQES
ncbi:unnamed protein product [Lymnaea stagnalis]|uniref:TIR domain-containing protein n=1 Tax=Lymnaea stagnalis TaxID=6523 RepID=A0AAV2HRR2_LYMST